jgi:hypothetical protein
VLFSDVDAWRSQKALGTLPEYGNVMPKHVGATIMICSVLQWKVLQFTRLRIS